MSELKKFISLFCAVLICINLVSCAKKGKEKDDNNHKEISEKYEQIIMNNNEDKPVDSGASILGEGFSVNDFTFTSGDNTLAFSLDKNSFVKLLPGGTFFNYISPGSEVSGYDAGYKTARGLSLLNSSAEYISKYNIKDANALYVNPDDGLFYNPANGNFTGKLTVLFGSEDLLNYKILTDKDVEKYLYKMNEKSDGTYVNPKDITDLFSSYESLAALNITTDTAGTVTEVSIYKFDK